jgi:transposase
MDYARVLARIYEHLEEDHAEKAVMGCLRVARSSSDHLNAAMFLRELYPDKREVGRVLHRDICHLNEEAQKLLFEASFDRWLELHTLDFRAKRELVGTGCGGLWVERRAAMAGAYAGDLRQRVVAAAREGSRSPARVARCFAVGRSTVYRWLAAARDEGRLSAKPMRGGPKPTIRDEGAATLRRLIEAEPDLTLAEYRDRLAAAGGVRVHPWTLGRALGRLGLTRKKEGPARRRAGQR